MNNPFDLGYIYETHDGRQFENLISGNTFPPHIWRQGWRKIVEEQPEQPEPLTFEQIKARHFISEALGIAFEITPLDTYVLATEASLSPIPDGMEWKSGLNLALGTIINYSGSNFKVIQPHISQAGWSPSLTPALFKLIHEPYADWVQPLGAHDAYMMGDVVLHNGVKWQSDMDHNVWEPGVFGWSKV